MTVPPAPPQPPRTPEPPEPGHWLYRLSPAEWLRAADHELALCAEALGRRAVRPGITHARRAAGMAWNAVLAAAAASEPDARYGRSYMDHVKALADDAAAGDGVPDEVREAARFLRDTPPAPPALVKIGKPDLTSLEAARTLVEHARARAGA